MQVRHVLGESGSTEEQDMVKEILGDEKGVEDVRVVMRLFETLDQMETQNGL